jgi:DNA-binding NtrC family response regulator
MANEYRVDRLIGDNPAIRRARRQVELAANTRAGVLIVGPPGGGRQHVAKTIHYAGNITTTDNKTRGSLVPLACSVLDPDLIRSTVAALSGPSLGDASQKSTLLLNEADELPAEAQAELAKIISQQSFRPRIIATSRRPLDELVDEGTFRADLASLLGTIVIDLPPLAKRREDIPLLVQMFVEKENAKGEKQIGGLKTDTLDMLDDYDWPGNVDELALVITEAHQAAESTTITATDLPKKIHLAADAAAHPRRPQETIVLDDFLAQIERELLERAMKVAKGNKAKAARMLGLTRPRLYRRLIQLGLEKTPPEKEQPEEIDFQEADDDEGQDSNE